MARPLWAGTIQISLVGFAVEVYPATKASRSISFHELDRQTMGRVHRQNVAEEQAAPNSDSPASAAPSDDRAASEDDAASSAHKTSLHLAPKDRKDTRADAQATNGSRHVVDKADIVKGFEYEKGKYALVEPEELRNLRLAGKRTVEISQFSKLDEIDPVLYEKPYFVLPKSGPQAKAFAVMRQAMIETGMAGIGEIVFSGRQHLMSLAPPHDTSHPGMMLYTLRFATELRDVREYVKEEESLEADPSQLGLAKQLIDVYARPFELSKFKDHYDEALRELVQAKINNQPVAQQESAKKPTKVIDLMDALRKSLAQRGGVGAASRSSKTASHNAAEQKSVNPAKAKGVSAAKRVPAKKPKSA
jgi:DNA end-binding protein Ku